MYLNLKPCPFCKTEESDVGFILHKDDCYLMLKYMGVTGKKLEKAWNTRPIEDELITQIDAGLRMI